MLKALGHSGFGRFLLELGLPDEAIGSGSGLAARVVSLAQFAIKNPLYLSPERRTIAYEIVLRAIEIWHEEATSNLSSGEREKFSTAMAQEGLVSMLTIADENTLTIGGEEDGSGWTGASMTFSGSSLEKMRGAMSALPLNPKAPLQRSVFIVHGHDDAARTEVARFLQHLEFSVTILHEQANRGRTIIEKFEAHSDVGFVVVLLTPDDFGGKGGSASQQRARQNVILEWGYFIGRLGRPRVCALKKGDIELPSDILGIVWEIFDDHGAWKNKLARELAEAGFGIDWAKAAQ